MIETQVQKGNDVHLLAVDDDDDDDGNDDDDDDEGNVAQKSDLNERGTNTNALLIDVWYKIKFGWGKVQIMYAVTRNVQTLPSTKEFASAWRRMYKIEPTTMLEECVLTKS